MMLPCHYSIYMRNQARKLFNAMCSNTVYQLLISFSTKLNKVDLVPIEANIARMGVGF